MKVLIIDDHAMFRRGIALLLEQLPGEKLFLEAGSCEDGFAVLSKHPDVALILLDLALPGMGGLEGLKQLRSMHPTTPIAMLSGQENPRFMADVMQLGANGFIPKSCSAEVLLAALQVVLAGGTYLPGVGVINPTGSALESRSLTTRQLEVLDLLCEGRSNREIADALGMRVNTVRAHLAVIFRQLNVDSRHDAARVALAMGRGRNVG